MIAYDLQCANGHSFEGWFEDEAAYTDQKDRGLLACPVCNETVVSRVPSVFAIKSARSAEGPRSGLPAEMLELGKQMAQYVEKNFDDVGCEFAKEALKMHYGVKAPRNIRGTSTKEEEKTLKQEGIEFFKVPLPARPDSDA
jgi:hypothetical protein